MTVTESCLILRWLCLSIRDVFISFLIFILIVIILLLILKDFFPFLFFFTQFSPLPSLLYLNSAALSGLLMVILKRKKKSTFFAIKGMRWVLLFCTKKKTKTFLSHSQPCWLFFLKTLTESLLVCFYFFALTDLIKLLIKWILCPRCEWLVCFEMVLLTW